MEINKAKLSFWGGKASFSLLDQGFFSGANFIVSLFLARYVDPSAYGEFSIVYTIFLFVSGFYNSLVLEPINVLGLKHHSGDLKEYIYRTLGMHLFISVVLLIIGLIITSILFIFRVNEIYCLLSLFVSISIPFIFFFWVARQCAYLRLVPKISFLGSLVYAISYIAGFFVIVSIKSFQISNVFILMAFSSLLGGLFIFKLLGINIFRKRIFSLKIPDLFTENWEFGKWILFASISFGISTQLYLPLIGFTLGSTQAGVIKAFQNFFLPFSQALTAFCLIITPFLSRIRISNKDNNFIKYSKLIIIGSLVISFLYSALVILISPYAIKLIYKKDLYMNWLWIIPILSLTTIISALNSGLGVICRVIEKTKFVFWAKTISAIITVFFCIYLIFSKNLMAILICMILSLLVESISLFCMVKNDNKYDKKNY